MASEAQVRANRRNGELGNGPKTAVGKQRSAQNALKHGLRSRRLWATKPEEHALINLAERLWGCHAPVGPQEETLVKLMIYDLLTIDRLQRIESSVLTPPELKPEQRPIGDKGIRKQRYPLIPSELRKQLTRWMQRVNQVERENGMRSALRLLDEIERGVVQADDEAGDTAQYQQQAAPVESVAECATQTAQEAGHGCEDTNGRELSCLFEVVTRDDAEGNMFEGLEKSFTANIRLFNLLLRYRTNHENDYLKKLHELQRLQATRQGESVALPMAVDLDFNPNDGAGEHEV
jgi:hypothetical protein